MKIYCPLATFLPISDILPPGAWCEALRRGPEDFLELTAKMRLADKVDLVHDSLIRIASGNQFSCQAALQLSKPRAWGRLKVRQKVPLQLPH